MKGQVVAEFMMYSMIAMVLVMVVLAVIFTSYSEKRTQQTIYEANQLGRSIQKELIIASEVKTGYERNLRLPDELLGNDYEIITYPTQIVIVYKEVEQYFNTPSLSGTFVKGDNAIRTNETTIIIN